MYSENWNGEGGRRMRRLEVTFGIQQPSSVELFHNWYF